MCKLSVIRSIETTFARYPLGDTNLTGALLQARTDLVDLYAEQLTAQDSDGADICDLALDCLDFAVDYSREEPSQDMLAEYRSAMGDVLHTLRNSLLH